MLDPFLTNVLKRRIGASIIDLGIFALSAMAALVVLAEKVTPETTDPGSGARIWSTADQARRNDLSTLPWVRVQKLGDSEYFWNQRSFLVTGALALLSLLLFFVVVPTLSGSSIGQKVFKLRVANLAGEKANFLQNLGRTVAGVVDGFPYFLPGALGWLLASRNPERQRIGDRLAKTTVIDATGTVRLLSSDEIGVRSSGAAAHVESEDSMVDLGSRLGGPSSEAADAAEKLAGLSRSNNADANLGAMATQSPDITMPDLARIDELVDEAASQSARSAGIINLGETPNSSGELKAEVETGSQDVPEIVLPDLALPDLTLVDRDLQDPIQAPAPQGLSSTLQEPPTSPLQATGWHPVTHSPEEPSISVPDEARAAISDLAPPSRRRTDASTVENDAATDDPSTSETSAPTDPDDQTAASPTSDAILPPPPLHRAKKWDPPKSEPAPVWSPTSQETPRAVLPLEPSVGDPAEQPAGQSLVAEPEPTSVTQAVSTADAALAAESVPAVESVPMTTPHWDNDWQSWICWDANRSTWLRHDVALDQWTELS